MRCNICNSELTEGEILQDEDDTWLPCGTCIKVIMETAYSEGFEPSGGEGPLPNEEEDESE